MKEIAKAVLAVMREVKNIEKSMTVGSGNMSYKGVPDFEVKKIIGESMAKNGLCVMPIDIEESTQIDRWEETSGGYVKQKQSIFTKAKVKFLLLHESGESQEIVGYGHGVDSQDKGSGKATTYALKYAMLYTFFVPTGKIDDSDNTHSDSILTKKKELLTEAHPRYYRVVKALTSKTTTLSDVQKVFEISLELYQKLSNLTK